MKLKVLSAATTWLVFISLLHLQLNVGWQRLMSLFGEREQLKVGFLPVT
jgi:hypothetical protein